jgi:hypothetical protein
VASGIIVWGYDHVDVVRNRLQRRGTVGILVAPATGDPQIRTTNVRVQGNVATGASRADIAFVPLPDAGGSCFENNTLDKAVPDNLEASYPCSGSGEAPHEYISLATLFNTPGDPTPPPAALLADQPSMKAAATTPPASVGAPPTIDLTTVRLPA